MTEFSPVSSLLDREMLDSHDVFVGWVRELLVDVTAGRIEYVRIELKGSQETREVVVPWSAVLRTTDITAPLKIAARKSTLDLLSEL